MLTEELEHKFQEVTPTEETEEFAKKTFQITFAAFLFFFFFIEAVFEKFHPKIGHATCLTVILGIVWSIIFYSLIAEDPIKLPIYTEVFRFPDKLFFDIILPPIIFNSGFSMKRKKFFENLGNIMIFGLVVTLVCFLIYTFASYSAL